MSDPSGGTAWTPGRYAVPDEPSPEDGDALGEALIAEMAAEIPKPRQTGDGTIDMLAESLGITHARAEYTLKKLERDGRLICVRAVVPGARVPMKVWRKPEQ